MTSGRLAILFEIAIVCLFALFLCGPWRWMDQGQSAPVTLAWLAIPGTLAHHGLTIAYATMTVTIGALVAAGLGALLSIVARRRGATALWAAGVWLFGCSVAILMPMWTAVGFLGALLLLVALRARFSAMHPASLLTAILSELWPLGYAAGFAALAWRYSPQLLIKTLLVALGVALVARAFVPHAPATQI